MGMAGVSEGMESALSVEGDAHPVRSRTDAPAVRRSRVAAGLTSSFGRFVTSPFHHYYASVAQQYVARRVARATG